MSHDVLSHSDHQTEARPRGLKRLVDRLISLAPFEDEPDVLDHAAEIIQEMREIAQPTRHLNQLEELAALSLSNPDQPELHLLIDHTAEHIVEEIAQFTPAESKNIDNIHSTWAAIKAWDVTRSEPTAQLCVAVLNNFRGAGQAQLARAYTVARDKSIPFNEALDTVNSTMEMAA